MHHIEVVFPGVLTGKSGKFCRTCGTSPAFYQVRTFARVMLKQARQGIGDWRGHAHRDKRNEIAGTDATTEGPG